MIDSQFAGCLECNDTYFVNSGGQCVKNQVEKIPNCLKYSNAITCIICDVGYMLNNNFCDPDKYIKFCSEYSIP